MRSAPNDEFNRGFVNGCGYAIAELVRMDGGSSVQAEEMFSTVGESVADYKRAGVEEFDLKEIRKVAKASR